MATPKIAAKDGNGTGARRAPLQIAGPLQQDLRLAPAKGGLYWVKHPDHGPMMAAVHGTAPFLQVELFDPFTEGPRLYPTAKQIEALVWLGEISVPRPETTERMGR